MLTTHNADMSVYINVHERIAQMVLFMKYSIVRYSVSMNGHYYWTNILIDTYFNIISISHYLSVNCNVEIRSEKIAHRINELSAWRAWFNVLASKQFEHYYKITYSEFHVQTPMCMKVLTLWHFTYQKKQLLKCQMIEVKWLIFLDISLCFSKRKSDK